MGNIKQEDTAGHRLKFSQLPLNKKNLLVDPDLYAGRHLARDLAKQGFHIVYCTKSNQTTLQEASAFRAMGLKVQPIVSLGYRLRNDFDLKPAFDEARYPWAEGEINRNQTKEIGLKAGRSEARFDAIWEQCRPPIPNLVLNDIVVTTLGRFEGWCRSRLGWFPEHTVVIYDHLDINDVSQYVRYHPAYVHKRIDGARLEIVELKRLKYFIRPERHRVGAALPEEISAFWCTNEPLLAEVIEARHPEVVRHPTHDPSKKIPAHDVSLVLAPSVRKDNRQWMKQAVAELAKMCEASFLLAVPGEHGDLDLYQANIVKKQVKGRLVGAIPTPSDFEITRVCAELGLNWKNKKVYRQKQVEFMRDQLHNLTAMGLNDQSNGMKVINIEPQLAYEVAKVSWYNYRIDRVSVKRNRFYRALKEDQLPEDVRGRWLHLIKFFGAPGDRQEVSGASPRQ
jgi:hypothetical protein